MKIIIATLALSLSTGVLALDLPECYQDIYDNEVLEVYNNDCDQGTTKLEAEILFDGFITEGAERCSSAGDPDFSNYAQAVMDTKKNCASQ